MPLSTRSLLFSLSCFLFLTYFHLLICTHRHHRRTQGTLEQSIAQHMRGGATAASIEAALLAMDAYGRAFETRTDAANAANAANASAIGAEREPCCHAWATLHA
jgi:hypothetical protein